MGWGLLWERRSAFTALNQDHRAERQRQWQRQRLPMCLLPAPRTARQLTQPPARFRCPPAPPACTANVQGDCLDGAAELIVKQYKEVKRSDIYYIESKKKERYFGDDGGDDA